MRRVAGVLAAVFLFWAGVSTAKADSVSVSARSAVLFEPTSGTVLFQKDAHTPRAMASTTKLMTALLAAEAGDWDRLIDVTAPMVAVEGSSLGLRGGDRLTLRDLVSGLLLTSGNDAANVIAITLDGSLEAFAERMNQKAAALGMTASHFVTPSGLDGEGHAASAYDMALLAAAVLQDEVLAAICASKTDTIRINDRTVTIKNHNRLLSLYEGAIGMKTGFTKKAGRCLVSAARRDGVTLIAVTLNDGDDWNDHMALFDYGFSQMRAVELPAAVLPPLPLTGGERAEVALSVPSVEPLILPRGQAGAVTMTVKLPPFAFAPITAGDALGEVVYTLDGEELLALPITAAETVAARPIASKTERFWDYVRLLFYGLLH